MIKASQEFVPVFIDTLKDIKTTKRFKEKYGSYPVLRVHDVNGKDIAGRLDGNLVAGRIPAFQVLKQMQFATVYLQRQEMQKQRNSRTRGQGNRATESEASETKKPEKSSGSPAGNENAGDAKAGDGKASKRRR